MLQIDQQQMLPFGTVLDGRYRIVQYLASGGFGNTYVAEDIHFGTMVAIKEFFMRSTNHRSTDGTTVEVSNSANIPVFETQLGKFRREAHRIYMLRNEHIIHVSDLFDANGTSYYVMDFIEGSSLANQIRQKPLSESETLDVAMQVLNALEAMHAVGLYHLDVKPANIMRDSRGHCTLIDFGASKQLTADERSTLSFSTMSYTPGYAPHEQVAQQTKNIGPWTDFYALGATLYRLLTGNPPPDVSIDDFAPDGRQFHYSTKVSPNMRHAISALMNPIHSMRPQSVADVRALFTHGNRSSANSSSKKWLWLVSASVALLVMILGIFLLTRSCGHKPLFDDIDDPIEEQDTLISYKKCPDDNHPHLIDLGLPSGTKWACCNVEATKPESYGGYYAWGEIEEKKVYNHVTYRYSSGDDPDGNGWYNENVQYKSLGTSICGTQYDVAHVKWGKSWQLPNQDQMKELLDQCNNGEWTTVNNVKGRRFTGPNGASIFLPAAGGHWIFTESIVGCTAGYWSGMQSTESEKNAYGLFFGMGFAGCWYDYPRDGGFCVRPVSQ